MGLQRSNISPRGHIQNVGGISAAVTTVQIEVDPLVPTTGNYSYFAFSPDVAKTTLEIVKVSSFANLGGGVWELTIVRAQRGTTAKTHAEGAVVEHVNTSEDINRTEEVNRLQRSLTAGEVLIFDPKKLTSPIFNSGVDSRFDVVENGEGDLTHTRSTASWYVDEDGNLRKLDAHAAAVWGSGYRWEPQRTNAWTYSEEIDNAAWTKTRCSITANDATAPDGAATSDKIVEDGTATSTHFITRTITGATDDTRQAVSLHAAPDERTWIAVETTDKAGATTISYVNLSTGALGTTGHADISVYEKANGHYRIELTFDAASGGTTPSVQVYLATGDGTISYSGDGASGAHVWGLQVEEDAAFVTSYIATTSSTATRNAGYVYDARWKRGAAKIVSQATVQNLLNRTVNPTDTTRLLLGGDAAGAISVVDYLAKLASGGLHGVCTNGKVYKLDNSGGAADAFVTTTASIGSAAGSRTLSVYVQGGTGYISSSNAAGNQQGAAQVAFGANTEFTRIEAPNHVMGGSGTRYMKIGADPGEIVYFILQQAETTADVTDVIPAEGGSLVTRNADNWTTPYTREFDWRRGITMQVRFDPKTSATPLLTKQILVLGGNFGVPSNLIIQHHTDATYRFRWINPDSTAVTLTLAGSVAAAQSNVIHAVVEATDDDGNGQLRAWVNGVEETPVAIALPTFGGTWSGAQVKTFDAWQDLFHAVVVPGIFTDPSVLSSLFEA